MFQGHVLVSYDKSEVLPWESSVWKWPPIFSNWFIGIYINLKKKNFIKVKKKCILHVQETDVKIFWNELNNSIYRTVKILFLFTVIIEIVLFFNRTANLLMNIQSLLSRTIRSPAPNSVYVTWCSLAKHYIIWYWLYVHKMSRFLSPLFRGRASL